MPRSLQIDNMRAKLGQELLHFLNVHPSQTLAYSFLALISCGAFLLMLPASTTNGLGASFIDALFTMTSASCLVGLSVYDVGLQFSRFGQVVILFGMQAGALGIMCLSAAFVSQKHQDFGALIKSIAIMTFTLEGLGALCLFLSWRQEIPPLSERLWWSIFHAVSAFANAGLSLFSHSFEGFVNDKPVCFILVSLITLGGLGYFVLNDLTSAHVWVVKKPKAVWDRLQIQTKVVIIAYLLLDVCGLLVFLFFEYDAALNGLSISGKISAAFFNVVSLRSAGFSSVPVSALTAPTIVVALIYMFIGAAPGGTGGGIKVTTAAVSIMALRAMLRGRNEVEIMGRRLPRTTVNCSVSIVLMAALFMAFCFILLLATEAINFESLLFEMVSAFGTVGLSLNATTSLGSSGKALIIMVMYLGRIGPLMLAILMSERQRLERYDLPLGRIAIG